MTIVPVLDLRETTDLTTADRAELGRYEAVIGRGLQTFVEVGNALAAIRDGKLYRGTHGTFEDYCRERWSIQRAHAYRLIESAAVVENLSPIGDILPANEAQARPLAKLEPEQQREAWAQAVEESDGKPTAAHVEKAAVKFAEPKPPKAKPEPVAYAPVWVLESAVRVWIDAETKRSAHDGRTVDDILYNLKAQLKQPVKGGWLEQLQESITERFRRSDLAEAINNVRDQRRQAKAQASARAVYVEPEPEPAPAPVADANTPDDLFAAGMVVNQHACGKWQWTIHNQAGGSYSGVLQDTIEAAIADARTEIERYAGKPVANQRIVYPVRPTEPELAELKDLSVLWPPQPELRREAITIHETNQGWQYAWRQPHKITYGPLCADLDAAIASALQAVAPQPPPAPTPPDPRIEDAQALIDLLVAARDTARAQYGELTGRHSDMLEFERGIETMLPPLQSLVEILS